MTTKIEWTDETWNPVTGCSKVSQGCKNCYAERIFPRAYGKRQFTDVRCHPERLNAPLHWKKPRRIFVNSMSDLFHENVPDEFIDRIFAAMALCQQHMFQVLTKRPERMRSYLRQVSDERDMQRWINAAVELTDSPCAVHIEDLDWPLPNVWLGVSVEDQATSDQRIPLLLQTPAAVRFISAEPLLGPIDLLHIKHTINPPSYPQLDWVIVGGESGPSARPSHPDWFRSLKEQCQAAGVACFMKQITERGRKIPFESFPPELQVREFPA